MRRLCSADKFWDVLGLQECQNIDFSSSWFQRMGCLAKRSDDGLAAVIYKNSSTIRASSSGDRWAAVLFHNVLFVSCYLPHAEVKDAVSVASTVLNGVSLLRKWYSSRFGHVQMIVAVDANVEISPNMEFHGQSFSGPGLELKQYGITNGQQQRERRRNEEELRHLVEGWMVSERLKAANTFGARAPTWYGFQQGAPANARVLDYLLIPRRFEVPWTDVSWLKEENHGRRMSDHALVRVEARVGDGIMARRFRVRRERDLARWDPASYHDMQLFGTMCDTTVAPAPTYAKHQSSLYGLAASIEQTPRARQLPPKKSQELLQVEEDIRMKKEAEGTEALRKLKRRRERLTRQFKRRKAEWEFPGSKKKIQKPFKGIKEGEELLENRLEIEDHLYVFGASCADVGERDRSRAVLKDLHAQVQASGIPADVAITFPTLMKARARLKVRKATGPSGLPAEVLKALPWLTCRSVLQLFNDIFRQKIPIPSTWRETLTTLMPKTPVIASLKEGTRLIAVEDIMKKWYTNCILLLAEPHLEPTLSSLALFGFVSKRSSTELAAAVKAAAQHAAVWGKDRSLLIASLDVKQAFQHLTISIVAKAFKILHVPTYLQLALLGPLIDETSKFLFDGLGITDVRVDKHVRTGGNESPLFWNAVVVAMWAEVIRSWDDQGYGYQVFNPNRPTSSVRVNHLLYADNVFVLGDGSDPEGFQQQISDLTNTLHEWGFEWKLESLELAAVGCDRPPSITTTIHDVPCVFPLVSRMNVLGNDVSTSYREPHVDVERRINAARRAFYAHIKYFCCKAVSWSSKCKRYASLVQSVLLYGAEGLSWDASSIHDIHVFEGTCLLRMFGGRKPQHVSWGYWKPLRLDRVRCAFRDHGYQSCVQRALARMWTLGQDVAAYFSSDWDVGYIDSVEASSRKRRRLNDGGHIECPGAASSFEQDPQYIFQNPNPMEVDGFPDPSCPAGSAYLQQRRPVGTEISSSPPISAASPMPCISQPSLGMSQGAGAQALEALGGSPCGSNPARCRQSGASSAGRPGNMFPVSDPVDFPGGGGKPHTSVTPIPDAEALERSWKRCRVERSHATGRISRAWMDARRLLMLCCKELEQEWSRYSAHLANRREYRNAGKVRRIRQGGEAAGEHPWWFALDSVFGAQWWKACDFSYPSFLSFSSNFLKSCGHAKAYGYFIVRGQGPGGGSQEEKPRMEETFSRAVSGEAAEKLAKRIASNFERQTVWDVCSPGVGLELVGDSMLVTQWANGCWRANSKQYETRVDRLLLTFERLYSSRHTRPAAWGKNFCKHIYREGNERADLLTHDAREGRAQFTFPPLCPTFMAQHELISLRGHYDGGVDATGTGIGYWLEAGFLPSYPPHMRPNFSFSSFSSSQGSVDPIVWIDVAIVSRALPPGSTVTEAELSALEGLLEAAEAVLRRLDSSPA